jgi:transcriptional regulator with XRE-family HTH domain
MANKTAADHEREIFRKMRRGLGLRQLEMSKATGIEQSRLSRWENGHIELSRAEILKIGDVIDVAIATRERGPSPAKPNWEADYRRRNGVTQHELAQKLGLDDNTISMFENGHINLDKETHGKLVKTLCELVNEKRALAGLSPATPLAALKFGPILSSPSESDSVEKLRGIIDLKNKRILALEERVTALEAEAAALREWLDQETVASLKHDDARQAREKAVELVRRGKK